MLLNVSQSLTDFDGEVLEDNGKPFLLRTACVNALMTTLEEDKNQPGEDKLTAYVLAKRLHEEDELDLTPEELTKLKDRVGKCFGPAVVGPVFQLLNG